MRVSRLSVTSALGLTLWFGWVSVALASSNLPLHHWGYDAIERLIALGVIDRALIGAKPFSRMQAAQHVARAIELVRADKVELNGREIIAEPLLERLLAEFRPELIRLGLVGRGQKIKRASCGPALASRVKSMLHPSAAGRPFDFGKIEAANITSMGSRIKQICGDGLSSEIGPR